MQITPLYSNDGILFQSLESPFLSFDEWIRTDLTQANGQPFGITIIDMLLSEEKVSARLGGVFFSSAQVADLEAWQLTQLGLPSQMPYKLKIFPKRLITVPEFNITYKFFGTDGQPVSIGERVGTIINIEGTRYTVLNPSYRLIELIDNFEPSKTDKVGRLLFWGKIVEQLPSKDIVDGPLGDYNIISPDHFTININIINDKILFEPYILDKPIENQLTGEIISDIQLLPDNINRFFLDFFQNNIVRSTYGLPERNFIILKPKLLKTLKLIQRLQWQDSSEKQKFISNPTSYIKEHLEPEFDNDELDSIFVETPLFLSSRIKGFGVWEPKENFFWTPSGIDWLDTNFVSQYNGIKFFIDEKLYFIPLNLLSNSIKDMQYALDNGNYTIQINDQLIPVDLKILIFLKTIEEGILYSISSTTGKSLNTVIVPDVIDNIINLEMKTNSIPDYRPNIWEGEPPLADGIELHSHQLEGFKWLKDHWCQSSPAGCLLADDMGLGKTVQALCFMAWLMKQMEYGRVLKQPILVVGPTGLLANWEEESINFISKNGLGKLFKAYGSDFSSLVRNDPQYAKVYLEQADWILTTYETLRDKIIVFVQVGFALVVFDEAQKIKNPSTQVTHMAKALKAEMSLAMTGTPVENSVRDIWTIVDAIKPGFLDSCSKFMAKYGQNAFGIYDQKSLIDLNNILISGQKKPPVMLRR
ncbi:MAG: DEAD/DEAH box helicase family protein, partial [Rickettsiales bacterium]|nr:DEAD/DEAH box helicase family protein [Rickettsiales bacterium]